MSRFRSGGILAALGIAVLTAGAPVTVAADPSSGAATASPRPGTEFGIGAGPSQVVLGSADSSGTMTVYDAGTLEVTITVTAYDFALDSAGKRVRSDQPLPVGIANWVKFDPSTFTLKSGESQQVTITVTRPTDAQPGDHYAVVEAGATLSDAAWKQVQARSGGGGVQVRTRIAYPLTLVTRVAGAIDNGLRGVLEVPPVSFTFGDFRFNPSIVDGGNIAAIWMPATGATGSADTLAPSLRLSNQIPLVGGDALLYDKQTDGSPAGVTVLPGATKVQTLTLTDVPIVGSYDYTYKLPAIAADSRADITVTGHFWIVNLQKVFLYIVLPLLVLILLLVLRVWRNRQDRKYRARLKVEAMQEARAALEREAAESRRVGPQGPQTPHTPTAPSGGGPRTGTIR